MTINGSSDLHTIWLKLERIERSMQDMEKQIRILDDWLRQSLLLEAARHVARRVEHEGKEGK